MLLLAISEGMTMIGSRARTVPGGPASLRFINDRLPQPDPAASHTRPDQNPDQSSVLRRRSCGTHRHRSKVAQSDQSLTGFLRRHRSRGVGMEGQESMNSRSSPAGSPLSRQAAIRSSPYQRVSPVSPVAASRSQRTPGRTVGGCAVESPPPSTRVWWAPDLAPFCPAR